MYGGTEAERVMSITYSRPTSKCQKGESYSTHGTPGPTIFGFFFFLINFYSGPSFLTTMFGHRLRRGNKPHQYSNVAPA